MTKTIMDYQCKIRKIYRVDYIIGNLGNNNPRLRHNQVDIYCPKHNSEIRRNLDGVLRGIISPCHLCSPLKWAVKTIEEYQEDIREKYNVNYVLSNLSSTQEGRQTKSVDIYCPEHNSMITRSIDGLVQQKSSPCKSCFPPTVRKNSRDLLDYQNQIRFLYGFNYSLSDLSQDNPTKSSNYVNIYCEKHGSTRRVILRGLINKNTKPCVLCVTDELLKDYETELFRIYASHYHLCNLSSEHHNNLYNYVDICCYKHDSIVRAILDCVLNGYTSPCLSCFPTE